MHKDIQGELARVCEGMTSNNIYSQLAYFIADMAMTDACPFKPCHEFMDFLGLLSDSYFGKVVMGFDVRKDGKHE